MTSPVSYTVFADESSTGDRYLGFGAVLLPTAHVARLEELHLAAVEELIPQRAVGAEALAGRPSEDAGSPAGWAGLLRLRFDVRADRDLDRAPLRRRLVSDCHGRIAAGGDQRRFQWYFWRWGDCWGGLSLDVLLEQPGQPAEHSRLR